MTRRGLISLGIGPSTREWASAQINAKADGSRMHWLGYGSTGRTGKRGVELSMSRPSRPVQTKLFPSNRIHVGVGAHCSRRDSDKTSPRLATLLIDAGHQIDRKFKYHDRGGGYRPGISTHVAFPNPGIWRVMGMDPTTRSRLSRAGIAAH
jgi:hypothetical protein